MAQADPLAQTDPKEVSTFERTKAGRNSSFEIKWHNTL